MALPLFSKVSKEIVKVLYRLATNSIKQCQLIFVLADLHILNMK